MDGWRTVCGASGSNALRDFDSAFGVIETIKTGNVTSIVGAANADRAGKGHTQAAKRISLENNKAENGGKAVCPTCGGFMSDPKQSKAGVPRDITQAEGDHIDPKSKGGDGATAKDTTNIE